jgi:hypothetical protein
MDGNGSGKVVVDLATGLEDPTVDRRRRDRLQY